MRHFLSAKDIDSDEIQSIVTRAHEIKETKRYPDLTKTLLGMVFFNQSLRTRSSFEAAMKRAGGDSITVQPGSSSWGFETEFGVKMDGDKAEHIKEAIRVLARYVDILAVRSFSEMESLEEDKKEKILNAFAEYSTVPVVSLESAMEHPCQMIADMLTVKELISEPKGKNFCLRWAPHKRGLPLAVPHSAALAAAHHGMNLTVAIPKEEYQLEESYGESIKKHAERNGGSFQYVYNKEDIPSDTEILYVKSWGAPALYGAAATQTTECEELASWMVDEEDLEPNRSLLHCLPVRRNLVVSDKALDHERSRVIDQAENRLWGQLSILERMKQNG